MKKNLIQKLTISLILIAINLSGTAQAGTGPTLSGATGAPSEICTEVSSLGVLFSKFNALLLAGNVADAQALIFTIKSTACGASANNSNQSFLNVFTEILRNSILIYGTNLK